MHKAKTYHKEEIDNFAIIIEDFRILLTATGLENQTKKNCKNMKYMNSK